MSETGTVFSCSFCGKTNEQVTHMVKGASGCICNECISICVEIIKEGINPMHEMADYGVFPA